MKTQRKSSMLIPTLVMAMLASVLLAIGFKNGHGQSVAGVKMGLRMTLEMLPMLLLAFIAAGMIQVLLPRELLSKWVGEESGIRGIIIGTIAGGFTPGGPYVSMPIVAGLLRSGASVGTMVAFITGWSLWAIARLPMEFGLLGWRFSCLRLASTFFLPPVAGLIATGLHGIFKS
jgi:uncharacterized membrane protein YraQ (UPF0718 family)